MQPIIDFVQSQPPLLWIGAGAVLSVGLFTGWRFMRRTSVSARNHSTAAGRDIRINDR